MGFNTFPCNPYPISTEELNKGNNDDLNTRVAALESDVSDLNSQKANQITIAPFFNAETAYTAGDLVYYNGLTYRCTNDHEGAWDADDFAATTIENELATLKSGLTNLENGTKTLLGKLQVTESVQLPSNWKRLYMRVNISDYFNGSISAIDGGHILIPFSVSSWACTINIEISGSTVSFASETTIAGTKDSGWTTYVEVYYT